VTKLYSDGKFTITRGFLGKGLIVRENVRRRKHGVPPDILSAYGAHMDYLTSLNLPRTQDAVIAHSILQRMIAATLDPDNIAAHLFKTSKPETIVNAAREAFAELAGKPENPAVIVYQDHNFRYSYDDEVGLHFVFCKRTRRQARAGARHLSMLRQMLKLCETDFILTPDQKLRAQDRCHVAFCASVMGAESDPTRRAFEHGDADRNYRLIIGLI